MSHAPECADCEKARNRIRAKIEKGAAARSALQKSKFSDPQSGSCFKVSREKVALAKPDSRDLSLTCPRVLLTLLAAPYPLRLGQRSHAVQVILEDASTIDTYRWHGSSEYHNHTHQQLHLPCCPGEAGSDAQKGSKRYRGRGKDERVKGGICSKRCLDMSLRPTLRPLCLSGRLAPSKQLLRVADPGNSALSLREPHAPHGRHADGAAGPSRCFCTSARQLKASELPFEELPYECSALDEYRHTQLPTTSDYWQPSDSTRSSYRLDDSQTPAKGRRADLIYTSALDSLLRARKNEDPPPAAIEAAYHDFFTPAVRQRPQSYVVPVETAPDRLELAPTPPTLPTYMDSLDQADREAADDRWRLLLRSGERSLPALAAAFGDIQAAESEQVHCHILTQCIKSSEDARLVFDLYRSWPSVSLDTSDIPPGLPRSTLCKMQSGTVYRCCDYLHTAGMTRQAATMVCDARLKPSQSRFLLERLVYDFKVPSVLLPQRGDDEHDERHGQVGAAASFAIADARLAVRKMCDAMTNLLADGVSFKRKTINRTLKLLCLTRARSTIVRLLRTAQRRAQIDLSVDGTSVAKGKGRIADGLRSAGGFSRLRAEKVKMPQVVSTKVMEEAMRLLCSQDSGGARTAYELLCALDESDRTSAMYDALMTMYGSASTDSPVKAGAGYRTVDEQLWSDICTLSHLNGPTILTMSSRIVCHARNRRPDLIKSDLAYLRTRRLGSVHDLTEHAKLCILRCAIETGSLFAAFRFASTLLSHPSTSDAAFREMIVHTLLKAARHIRIDSPPSPSRAQLLKRFLRHFSHLFRKFPDLQPTAQTLALFVRLLDGHQHWIESHTLWRMLRIIGLHFNQQDPRLVGIIKAFATIFAARGETSSAQQLHTLADKLHSHT